MPVALFIHFFSLVLAYGAVMVVDWTGLWFVLKRKSKQDLLKLTTTTQPLIWLGLIGLVASGIFLHPDLNKPLTQLKMLLVVVIFINGLNLHFVQRAMQAEEVETFWQLPRKLIVWSVVSISLSQIAWLGAMIIGFINANSH